MSTTVDSVSAEIINPFLSAAANVFQTMLDWELKRGQLYLAEHVHPEFEISGVIGLTGKYSGTVSLSMGKELAIEATEVMLGERPSELDADVVDTIGELTNMVAGNAKTQLEKFSMSLGLPSVIIGMNHSIEFPRGVTPIGIPFESPIGSVFLDVGLRPGNTN